ncbi:cation-translocating P-type ATPase [Thiomicrorhabdus xiamenensis]|uniref:Cation-transporting P-type ATPase n=1 Tax=Thiomicrorhabdus xiamenensis TaxID=2739063 RepID=A0A7D4SZQ2_9GAMM|nr:cation-transporting P-type ATPase [Thiomicrorhabdus xiamenensis]QKI88385.1 cation-transporting P-type ATPase [Thiomicrorhabdus xiamenensis]
MLFREPVERVFAHLKSSPEGLNNGEIMRRLRDFGQNQIAQSKKKDYRIEYLKEYISFFPILLEVAGVLALVADYFQPGEGNDILAYAVFAAVFINATFTFWQKFKADKAMEALLKLVRSEATVLRDGKTVNIDATQVVPGDILILSEGDKVAADAILFEANDLYLNLSVLNGESTPSLRKLEAGDARRELDAKNMVFAGASITNGNGLAVVSATGEATEFGKIARMTAEVGKTETPIEKEIKHMTAILTVLALAAGVVFFLLGWFSDRGLLISAIFALSLIVANVPEGLLPTITLSLSLASQRMARRQALIKNLNSVETLGSATVICTDKTGTLTQNEMTVQMAWLADGCHCSVSGNGYFEKGEWRFAESGRQSNERLASMLQVAAVNTRANVDHAARNAFGDPTEIALLVAAKKSAASIEGWEKVKEYAFSSDRKMMSTLVEPADNSEQILTVKGALEAVLPLCTHWQSANGIETLDEHKIADINSQNQKMAEQAYRVLAIAKKIGDGENDLIFLGLLGLMDPPRSGVKEAIEQCYSAHIRIMMITGDNPVTARAIGERIGLKIDEVLTGHELDNLSDTVLRAKLSESHLLFARMASAQKLRIAQLLQENGEVVAMTGDGVNDSPALKQADIGIAMGSGTDVAKESGDMILLDDNFRSIVASVEEGRTVYFNIKKLTTYILSSNVPEIVPYVLSFFLKIPMPLSVIQILLIDLGTDQLPGLGLGSEKPEKHIMQRPPVGKNERILDWEVFKRGYFMNGVFEGAAAMFAFLGFLFLSGWQYGDLSISDEYHRQAMTMTLLGAITCQMANVFTLRSWEDSIWNLRGVNKMIWFGVGTEILFVLLILYAPPVQTVFNTATVPLAYLLLLIPFPVLLLLNHEWYKKRLRNRWAAAA